jgi:hypothetical protein
MSLDKTACDQIHRLVLSSLHGPVGRCLEIAWQGYCVLKQWPGAPRALIQAGSAQWPRVPPELDDGVMATHFAYEWQPDSEINRLIRSGILSIVRRRDGLVGFSLPEMHVWLGCPDTGEIIDFSTGLWPAACKATLGLDWLAPLPPDYLWADEVPEGVRYVADRGAIDTALYVLHQQGRHCF